MSKTLLISRVLGVSAEPFPDDLKGQNYALQAKSVGAAYYPELLLDVEVGGNNLINTAHALVESSLDGSGPFSMPEDEGGVDVESDFKVLDLHSVRMDVRDVPESIVFAAMAQITDRRLKNKGVGKLTRREIIDVTSYSYGVDGGIGQHADRLMQVVKPLRIVALTGGRVTEFVASDGRLIEVVSSPGDVLVLPQTGSYCSDWRVEHAVASTVEDGMSHTVQISYRDRDSYVGDVASTTRRRQDLDGRYHERAQRDQARWEESFSLLVARTSQALPS